MVAKPMLRTVLFICLSMAVLNVVVLAQASHSVPLILSHYTAGSAKDGTSWEAILDDDPATVLLMGGSDIQATFGLQNGPQVISSVRLRIQPLGFKGHIGAPKRFQVFASSPAKPDSFVLVAWDSIPEPGESEGDWFLDFQVMPFETESLRVAFAPPSRNGYVTRYFLNDLQVLSQDSPVLLRKNLSWGVTGLPYTDTLTIVGMGRIGGIQGFDFPRGLEPGLPVQLGLKAVWKVPVSGIPTDAGDFNPGLQLVSYDGRQFVLRSKLSVTGNPQLILLGTDAGLKIVDRNSGETYTLALDPGVLKDILVCPDSPRAIVVGASALLVVDLQSRRLLQRISQSASAWEILADGKWLITSPSNTDSLTVFKWQSDRYEKITRFQFGQVGAEVLRLFRDDLSDNSFYVWTEVNSASDLVYHLTLQKSGDLWYDALDGFESTAARTLVPLADGILHAKTHDSLYVWNSQGTRLVGTLATSLGFCHSAVKGRGGQVVLFPLREYLSDPPGWAASSKLAVWMATRPDSLAVIDFGNAIRDVAVGPSDDSAFVLTSNAVWMFSMTSLEKHRLPGFAAGAKQIQSLFMPPPFLAAELTSPGGTPRFDSVNVFLKLTNRTDLLALQFDLIAMPEWIDLSRVSCFVNPARLAPENAIVERRRIRKGLRFLFWPKQDSVSWVVSRAEDKDDGTLCALRFEKNQATPFTGTMMLALDNIKAVGLGGTGSCSDTARVPFVIRDGGLQFPRYPAGDVNGDGQVDLSDLLRVMEVVASGVEGFPLQLVRLCDVDFNGRVDERDIQLLRDMVLSDAGLTPPSQPKRTPMGQNRQQLELLLTASRPIDVGSFRLHFEPDRIKVVSLDIGGSTLPIVVRSVPVRGCQDEIGVAFVSLLGSGGNTTPTKRIRIGLRIESLVADSEIDQQLEIEKLSALAVDGSRVEVRARIRDSRKYEVDGRSVSLPRSVGLTVFPNPFNESTLFSIDVPAAGKLRVEVYDALGRWICRLHDGRVPAGRHQFRWNSRSGIGTTVPSGIYFCRVTYNGQVVVRKLVLLR